MNNLNDFEKVCNQCCSAIDQQIKVNAETFLNDFTKKITLVRLQQILRLCSQTAVYVVTQYMFKNLNHYSELKSVYELLSNYLNSWLTPQHLFVRNGEPLQGYMFNTYIRLLGECMKKLYKQHQHKQQLTNIIQSHPKTFMLFEYKAFLDAVGHIDTSMGFLCYRNLIYMFQDDVIPKIADALTPFFYRLTQSIRLNELINLQENMSVNDNINNTQKRTLTFTIEELTIATIVLELLKSMVTFTYNITYSQFDMDNSYDNCAISYPDLVTQKFTKGEFYESLFFLTERFILEQPDHKLLETCLRSLQKIVLCRLAYIIKENRRSFIQKTITGITRLMKSTNNLKLISQLMDFNIKMLNNIELRKFRKYQPHFTNWLHLIEQQTIYILKSTPTKFENNYLKENMELIVKLISYASQPKLKPYVSVIKQICQNILNSMFLAIFNQQINLSQGMNFRKVKQLKHEGTTFFNPMRLLIIMNLQENLKNLLVFQQKIYQNYRMTRSNFYDLINFHLLMIEICQASFLEKNSFYEPPSQQCVNYFGTLISTVAKFIEFYSTSKQSDHQILQMVLLLMTQRMLTDSLLNMDIHTPTVGEPYAISTNKLFDKMQIIPKGEPIQPFLIFSFTQILGQLKSKDQKRIKYAMQSLSFSISKLKWGVKRDFFKEMQLPKKILDYCLEVASSEFLEIGLFKIISILGFDDCLDPYKERINTVLGALKINNLQTGNYLTLIYDLRGIASQIDTLQIYRYFLIKISPTLKLLFEKVFKQDRSNLELLKITLKLNKALLQNKSQRLGRSKVAPTIYNLVNYLMVYWNNLFQQLNNNSQHNFDVEVPISLQLLRIFNQILKGGYLNLSLLLTMPQNCVERYIVNLLLYMIALRNEVFLYPKLVDLYFFLLHTVARELSEFIFNFNNQVLIKIYSQIFHIVAEFSSKLLLEYVGGNRKYQSNLLKSFEILAEMTKYQVAALERIHKKVNLSNVMFFKNERTQDKYNVLLELFKLALQAIKNAAILHPIVKVIQNTIKLFPQSYQYLYSQFSKDYDILEGLDILKKLYFEVKDSDLQLFSSTMNQWLKTLETTANNLKTIDY